MSKLEELIQKYCPDGVEYAPLGDCLSYEQPTKYLVESTKYDDSFPIPVLTAGQTFILGYTKESSGVFVASQDNPVIIFDDFTTSFHWVEFSFKVKSSAMKMLRPIDEKKALFRYLYHCMKSIMYVPGDHTRQWIGTYSQFEIPLPPLPVQEEIVRVLDTFTELQAELQAELQKRIQQYNYYRDNLLSFEGRSDVEWKKLGDVADLLSGFPFDSSQFTKSGIRLMRGVNIKRGQLCFNDTDDRYWESEKGLEKYIVKENDLVISMDGSLVGRSFGMVKKEYLPLLLVQRVARIRSSSANIKYIFYCICNWFPDYVDKKKTQGAIPHISMKDISNFPIPFPSLAEQQKIVNVLDRFEALTNDLTAGLPAEIEKRRQQYEFYRDKLLTFKRKEA